VLTDAELGSLEDDVQRALAAADGTALRVLGHGEISLVLGWPADAPRWACKRLPPFPSADRAQAYADTLGRYLTVLAERGVTVLDTEVRSIERGGGGVAVYCVQPVLPAGTVATDVVRAEPDRAAAIFGQIVDHVFAATDDRVGFDAQLSNWAAVDGGLVYLDVTTPLLRGADGREELDTDLFLASFPWLLRAPVKRFVVPGVIDRYHQPRTVVLDLAANLLKERLEPHLPTVLAATEGRVDPPLSEAAVRADYRSDARTWAALQALRRADRAWQRRVRRRPYPFLLPDRIDR
jgi:hypothetical protein